MTEIPTNNYNFNSLFQKKTKFSRKGGGEKDLTKEEEGLKAKELRDKEYVQNLDRGPSLVEEFLSEKKKNKVVNEKESYHFNRERDLGINGRCSVSQVINESKDYLKTMFK